MQLFSLARSLATLVHAIEQFLGLLKSFDARKGVAGLDARAEAVEAHLQWGQKLTGCEAGEIIEVADQQGDIQQDNHKYSD